MYIYVYSLLDVVKCSKEGMTKSNGKKYRRLFIGVGHILLRYGRRVCAVNRALSPEAGRTNKTTTKM